MSENTQNGSKPILTDTQYNLLRSTVQYVLPAAAVLYSGLALIWGFGYAEQVVGTIAAITTFSGVLLGLSRRAYSNSDDKYDGELVVKQSNGDTNILGVVGQTNISDFIDKGEATLKIVSVDEASQR